MGRKMKQSMRATKTTLQAAVARRTPPLREGLDEAARNRRPVDAVRPEPFRARRDRDEEDDEDDEKEPREEAAGSNGPDDALGVYLRQMGAIPLLNRKQELDLAQKLERHRVRFRKAALANWLTL